MHTGINLEEYIQSGIIESYVLGLTTYKETVEVEKLAGVHPQIASAIDVFSIQLEEQLIKNAIEPDVLVKPMLMASLDYMKRLAAGEKIAHPPLLHPASVADDYSEWLNRKDMILPANFSNVFIRLISSKPQLTTAIVWMKDALFSEIHHNEHEQFLVIEGSCKIEMNNAVYNLGPGNYLSIPLHSRHTVKVPHNTVCKVVLQRSLP